MKELAICIPAYNRVDCLLDLLKTITSQLDGKNNSKIQVCISDDCSPNDLSAPVFDYMKDFDVELIFHRNVENIESDRNKLKCIEISTARFCWLLGDDDGISSGRINTVLECIDKFPNVAVFIGNRYVCDRNLKIRLKERWTKEENDYLVDFTNENEIIRHFDMLNYTTALGFQSILIVKKEAWDTILESEYAPYIGTIYIHVAKFLMMLYKKDTLCRISDYIVLSRFGNDNFFDSLKQRIFLDFYGFLMMSDIFGDSQRVKDSFFGIVRRHFNNVFLYAMSYTSELSNDEIAVVRKLGYTEKQVRIFTKRSKIKSLCGFAVSVLFSAITDVRWFYKTCLITIQKLINRK